MKIAIIVEGQTEKAFIPALRRFLSARLAGQMPNLDPLLYNGRIPKEDKLKRVVENLLSGARASDAVIALTDVYTGGDDFVDAADAKRKMRDWVGANPAFHPHAAQYDFEAWLLPYWPTIQRLSKTNQAAPGGNPEKVNHTTPPAHRLQALFERGKCRDSYQKPRDAGRILRENDLTVAAQRCSELKALLNTILSLSGGDLLP